MKRVVIVLTLLLIVPTVYSASVGIDELFTIGGSDIKSSEGTKTYFYAGSTLVATNKEEIEYQYLDGIGSNTKGRSLPFGQELIDANERFEFTGKELDESDLHYFNARYYDSSIGRFLSVDPMEDEPPYQYVYNNPMNYVDPTGKGGFKKAWNKFWKFFGIDLDDATKHADDAARAAARQTDDEIGAFMDQTLQNEIASLNNIGARQRANAAQIREARTLHDVKRISSTRGGRIISLEHIPEKVEEPAILAIETLFKKGVQTTASSANANDLLGRGGAYISLHTGSMSPENLKVLDSLENVAGVRVSRQMDGNTPVAHIFFEIDEATRVVDLSQRMSDVASMFHLQSPSWGGYTEEQTLKIFRVDSLDEIQGAVHFSKADNLYYPSQDFVDVSNAWGATQ